MPEYNWSYWPHPQIVEGNSIRFYDLRDYRRDFGSHKTIEDFHFYMEWVHNQVGYIYIKRIHS